MARIEPLDRSELPQHEPMFALIEQSMGFVPSSLPTMAKVPGLMEALSGLVGTITMSGEIDPGLAQMVANVASHAAGCRYCQAHTATHASHQGVDDAKIAELWEFETSPRFTDAERAALRLARDAAQTPNVVTDDHFTELAEHYTETQIIVIVATISAFGFLNRWNDTMATTLEEAPSSFASDHLGAKGWEPGKHG
jgi:AhpD family alkylhydroperoxidase